MAASTTPRPADLPPELPANAADAAFVVWARQAGDEPLRHAPLAVAYSGGADSTALLHAAARHWPGPVLALHVHHGLQAAADGFEAHCMQVCAALGVVLRTAHVDARHAPGESPEEQARRHRYQALADLALAAGAPCVLLAQHADDQVETLLLALSRGAGMAGLAGMPVSFERHGMRFERPLLAVPAQRIRDDLQQAGIAYVQDPSNEDVSLTRNRIRQQLLPVLGQVFPAFRETFARSARHAAQAQALLEALAQQDLADLGEPPAIAALQRLPRERQANVLRLWLRRTAGRSGSAAQLDALLAQIAACTTRGHRIHLKVAHGHVLREGSRLAWRPGLL
ncbi:MAG: tRNA(Ile)-lysidine synthase [Paracidovorax wautersii]|uniref:tRNA(Ile)-lysidine synthase n=1 Tax=Paracidovorax wautersii TaxID=1177982 RepID=A0A7V8FKM7_9BURK|nr:MAG: tRNA(Ile)-lysidine synthase [Paracidovorax wautersii]